MRTWGAAAVALALVTLPACGASHARSDDVIRAGQLDIKLPPGWKVVNGAAVRPGSSANPATGQGQAPGAPAASSDTVPLAKQDPTTAFFKATGQFQNCLKTNGVKFIGAPDQKNPSSPTNNPDYIQALTTCAAQSHIVQALQDMQKAQDNLTPQQIKDQNESYLRWRTCMIGRGWQIAQPKPDEKGRLFGFNANSGNSIKPPAGQDLFNSKDVQDCAAKAQQGSKK